MLQNECVVTFSEAAKVLPRVNGRRPHASTIWRWARKGVQGVKLETRRLGGRFVTSVEALERFSKALADVDLPDRAPKTAPATNRPRTELQRQRDIQQAEADLAKAGI